MHEKPVMASLSLNLLTVFPHYKTRVLDAGKSAWVYVSWELDTASKFGEGKNIYGTPASYTCKFFLK